MSKFKIIAFLVLGFIVYKVFVAVKDFEVHPDKVVTKLRNGEEITSDVIIGAGGSFDLVSRRIREIENMPMKWRD